MKRILSLILIQVLIAGSILNAQKISLKKGNLGFIKGQKSILVTFDYSNMAVGKFDREEEYIAKKVEDYNKSEAGKGDKWKEAWKNDRATRYEPKFEQLFNENASKIGLTGKRDVSDAQIEMNNHTTFTETRLQHRHNKKACLHRSGNYIQEYCFWRGTCSHGS
jgi:hypothetical protein